jgi:hypothetical protein
MARWYEGLGEKARFVVKGREQFQAENSYRLPGPLHNTFT